MDGKEIKHVYLWGGFGNILYQLNFAQFLLSQGFSVVLITVYINEHGFIGRVNKHHKGTISMLKALEEFSEARLLVRSSFRLYDILPMISLKTRLNFFRVRYFVHDNPTRDQIKKTRFFLGYFQRFRWRSKVLENAFKSLLIKYNDLVYLEEVRDVNSLVVHMRLGDKMNDSDFYINYHTIENLFQQYSKVFIIGDSKPEIDNYINSLENIGASIINLSSNSILQDFIYLSQASNLAIPRSSFSWWAGELGESNNSIYQPCPLYKHLGWSPYTIKTNRICYEKF